MNDPAVPPIGVRLREARVKRGLSVRGLARVVDVSPSLISQIETGKSSPSVSTLYAITNALHISIEDVFGEPDEAAGSRRETVPAGAAPIPISPSPTSAPAGAGAATLPFFRAARRPPGRA